MVMYMAVPIHYAVAVMSLRVATREGILVDATG